jgi:glycosyltransferase involved in cell wall biosynthesis
MLLHEETLATIAAADALIFPSHAESYGAVVFEALALNTTVFATPVGAVPAVDHPRLHVGTVDELAEIITQSSIESADGLDTETLERFSMERYTDELLGAFEGRTAHETAVGEA